MIILRLFESGNPFDQIDERRLDHNALSIGRDLSADWVVSDAHGDLSRKHCTLILKSGSVYLRDTSTNGVTLGSDRVPVMRGESVRLSTGDTFNLGRYMVLVDGAAVEVAPSATVLQSVASPSATATRPEPAPMTDAALLERFCLGAGLEASSFAGEDPSEVMTRLGEVYRQVVDDLCHLMRDRAMLKDQLHMDRTTISARENNPLKWAPSHQIAVELLQEGESGFLKGASAFRASFADLRLHGVGLLAGSQSAVAYVLQQLDPDELERGVKRQSLTLPWRHETLWKRYRDQHASLVAEAGGNASGGLERALRTGYEERLTSADNVVVAS